MALHPPSNRRERILLYGSWGTGKSFSWQAIRQWMARTGSPGRVYCLDTDVAIEAMVDSDDFYTNCEVEDCGDWDSLLSATGKFVKKANRANNDWLVVDMIDAAWSYAQAGFSEQAFGKRLDEWFIAAKKSGENIGGDYGSNWGIINRMYAHWIGQVIRFPGHVLACAPEDDVQMPDQKTGKGGDDADIRDMFGRTGKKPKGQKSLGHQFHSIIRTMDGGRKGYLMTSIKDRNREKMAGEAISDFVTDYLIKRAGWRP